MINEDCRQKVNINSLIDWFQKSYFCLRSKVSVGVV